MDRLAGASQQRRSAALLVEEAGWVSRLKDRLIGADAPGAAVALEVRLRAGAGAPARFVSAALAGVKVTDGKTILEIPWRDLHPEMVPALVERLIAVPEPADRLAAAIVCLRAGEKAAAHRLLSESTG